MSETLHIAEHTLQEVALAIMALVYLGRLYWLTRFFAGRERQAPTASGNNSSRRSLIYSWANIAMPWAMESSRTKIIIYAQFVIFHLGVTAAIILSFVIPYGYGDAPLSAGLVIIFRISIGAAFIVGIMRIVRRVGNKYLRAISSPDDHFSLWFLTIWFGVAFMAVPNDLSGGELILLLYFIQTAFFLIYVPFSKISHYLYYPFTRYYLGKTMGRRGVYPLRRAN